MSMAEHQQNTKSIDERFDEVAHAFVEQRDFITFCFDRARQDFSAGLAGVKVDIAGLDNRVAGLDNRVASVEGRLGRVEDRLGRVDDRLGRVDNRLGRVEHRLDRHELILSEILNEVKALGRGRG